MAAERFHSQRGDSAPRALGEHLLGEAEKVRVERIQRHLHRIERKSSVDHLHVDGRILMARKTREADFPLFLRFAQSFGRAVWPNEELGVVVPTDSVYLPEVQMISLKPSQRLLEHFS